MSARYWKGREVLMEYKQGRLVYEKQTSIPDYLCFTALEAGTFTLTIPAAVTSTYLSYVEYSLDGRNWNHTDITSSIETIDVQVAQGDKVYWRGSGACMTATSTTAGRQSIFSSTARFDVSGYIMSLLKGDNFASYTHLTNYSTDGVRNVTFARLFEGCTTLVGASSLVLPTFTSWHTYIFSNLFAECTSLTTAPELPSTSMATSCYNSMFYGCTSLTATPTLPATNLAADCYYYMFRGCTNLVTATSLPATILASNCYHSMFVNCTSLETGFVLPATILANGSYYQMFYGCTHLKYVKCLATDISATNCLTNWLYNVSSTGTFIQAEGVTWPSGASGIPTGWVDIEKRTMPQGYKQVEYLLNPNYGYININRALNLNSEKVEIAFVKMASGSSSPLGNSTYNYRYGSLKVINQSSALAIRVGVDYDDQVYKQVSISSVTDDKPHTFQYVGNSSGFQLYFDGALKSTETCAWDTVSPYQSNLLFSANTNAASSPASFHTNPIYYLKIWDSNNTLAVDYVACVRESDNVAGFYDFANSTFITSSNSNTFVAGQEI